MAHGVRLPRMPGLDGLRALAVVAVLLYHAGLASVPGGFLGVEVFFVISGYLITALLVTEWRRRGRIDLAAFWMRRARRLLPALYLVVVATLAYAVLFLPGEVAGLRGDALSAFGYVTNWYLIFGDESYFEAMGRPSLLRHLWSLAVEEQFYLLWPPMVAVGISLGARRRRLRRLMFVSLAVAGGSALLMAALYAPAIDPSRIYYGTDTRATGLLFGAALAFVWRPGERTSRETCARLARRGSRPAGRLRRRWGWIRPCRSGRPRRVLPEPRRVPAAPVQGRLRGGRADNRSPHRGRSPPPGARRDPSARLAAPALGRGALLRHLPLALAGLHGHPPPARRAL